MSLLGNTILALVGVIDKFILTKAVPKPIVFVFYSTIFVLPVCLLLPLKLVTFPTVSSDYLLFAISGLCFAGGLWAMYLGVAKGEISRIGPLIGAATPFFILFLSRTFLHEQLSSYAFAALFCLTIGSLIISFEQKNNTSAWHSGLGLGIVSGLLFAISHTSAKYVYEHYSFISGFVWTKLPIGIFAVFVFIFSSTVRQVVFKKQNVPTAATPVQSGADSPLAKAVVKYQLLLVGGNIFLGAAGAILLQYAIALGSVTLVNALAGVQYAMLVVFVAVISKFWPNVIKETFTRRDIIQKTIAVVCISLGLVLLLI